MSFRFWRRVRIIPGLRVNLSKTGPSLSIGGRGAWFTIGPRGRRVTVGLPGTGLFWTERLSAAVPPHTGRKWAFVLAVVFVALAVIVWAAQTAGGG